MKYIASISDKYPLKHYGEFVSENDSDYLLFVMGKEIHNVGIDYKIVYNVSDRESLYKWDILAVNRTFFLVNERVRQVLNELGIEKIEYFPSNAFTKEGFPLEGYYIFNILDDADIYRNEDTQVVYSERLVGVFKRHRIKSLTFYQL